MATEQFMFPASFAQQRLWFLDQMVPGTAFYNMSKASRFPFSINMEVLKKSLHALIQRHETLRTTFSAVNGNPFQVVASSYKPELPFHDLSNLDPVRREAAASELAHEDALRPFDLAKGPLMRASLVKLAHNDYIFLLSMHHIISDVWSVMIFFRELSTLYEAFLQNKTSPLAELPLQYADYAVWQLEYLKETVLRKQVDYWKKQLADLQPLELPLDKKRPLFQTFHGAHENITFDQSLTDDLKKLCAQHNVTMFMLLLAGLVALLHKYSNQDDIVIGAPIAGRNQEEIENIIGFFVNSIILRTRLKPGINFRDLLADVKTVSLEAFAHGDLPFEKLVEELHPQRDLSRNPLFQVLFQMAAAKENADPAAEKDGMDVKVNTSKFDLTLSMAEENGSLLGYFEYNTDLFYAETVKRMVGHYHRLLSVVSTDTGLPVHEIDILATSEKDLILRDWNKNTRANIPGKLIHEMISDTALRVPAKIAMYSDYEKINYGDLLRLTNKLANYFIANGVQAESTVAVCMDRSITMVVVHLAILKAGGAFVPLDPTYPEERFAFMVKDIQPVLLIASPAHAPKFAASDMNVTVIDKKDLSGPANMFETFSSLPPVVSLSPLNRAYMMFTSGSTGKPKGVEVIHAGLMNMVQWNIESYGITPADICLQMAAPAYDAYVYEIFPCLTAGATAFLVDDVNRASPSELQRIIIEQKISVCFLPTVIGEALSRESWPTGIPLRVLGTAGEKLRSVPSSPLPFHFLNLYGPTENTVIATWFEVKPGKYEQPPIGRPVFNTKLYVLDKYLNPVPAGVTGELFIGGKSLARGYFGRSALTAEKFIPDPFSVEPGSRLYCSGDLVRYLPDGNIEFMGRVDQQVKLRGYRVELEEVEKQLLEHPSLFEAAVIAREISPSNNGLVAYIVTKPGQEVTPPMLRTFLKEKLPVFMLPSIFIRLAELPKTISGKINRKALIQTNEPVNIVPENQEQMSAMEKIISDTWKQYLPVQRTGLDSNFFDMGGHSLMMAQVHFRLREVLGININLVDLFQYPTIRSLSKHLETIQVGRAMLV